MNSKQQLIILVSIFISTSAIAQGVRFGLETGVNIASLQVTPKNSFGTDRLSSKTGLKAGCVLDIGLGKGFSIETGLLYSMKGVKLSGKLSGQSFETQWRYNYIEIPLYAKYTIKGIVFGVGPYIGVIANASYKGITVDTSYVQEVSVGNDPNTDGVKRTDIGLNFKAGYAFPINLYLTAQYGFGITNTAPTKGFSAKNSVICFSVGYYFGKGTRKPKVKVELY